MFIFLFLFQMGRRELEALKVELAATRKEKFAFQGKLSQFKSALKATLQQNKVIIVHTGLNSEKI